MSILGLKTTRLRQSKVFVFFCPLPESINFNKAHYDGGWKASLTHRTESLCNRITGLAQNPTILVIRVDTIPPLPGYLFHDAYVLKVPNGAVHCR